MSEPVTAEQIAAFEASLAACSSELAAHESAKLAAHRAQAAANSARDAANAASDALADAKLAAGYDEAREPLALRLEDLAPRGVTRNDLTVSEIAELAAIRAALGV